MSIRQLIEKTRTYRRFDESYSLDPATLTGFIDLARLSGSAANRQPLKYIIVTSPEEREKLYPCLAWAGYLTTWEGPDRGERPTGYIVILGDKEISDKFGVDPGIAAQSIMLGATEAGLGGCIFASVKREKLRAEFTIPDQYDILLVLALGKPVEKVVLETIKENDVKYWRDAEAVHHVPKRTLDEIILKKKRTLFFIILVSLLSSSVVMAQEETDSSPILFRGVVYDAQTQLPVEGVQYYSGRLFATGADGLFSFYAHHHDTVIFERQGYRATRFYVSDTLSAREYTMGIFLNPDTLYISEVVIIPRLGDLRSVVMTGQPSRTTEQINATNNLRLSAYQSLAGINELGNPDANYQVIRQQQKTEAYEKGGIPSSQMVGLNPLIIIPALYTIMKGLPEAPAPPAPYLSAMELRELQEIHKKISGNGK